MRVFGGAALRRELALQIDASTIVPDLLDRQAAETRIRGYLPALLSSRRHALKEDISEDHETLHALGTPVLAIWGTDDPVIPQSSLARLTELNPDTHHVEVKWGGHAFPQTHPGDVAKALETFLRKTV
ncbi:MAG: alpha/beta hydrolase [Boseongicola sp.]|nr:alpha/beta hydrolase [Boseongicola sp.]